MRKSDSCKGLHEPELPCVAGALVAGMGSEPRVAELEKQLATLQEDFDDYQATSTEVQQELESEIDEVGPRWPGADVF